MWRRTVYAAAAVVAALSPGSAASGELFASSVVGTDFDFIREGDPSAFEALRFVGRGWAEMPDKRGGAGLFQEAFSFEASFADGARVRIDVDADFDTRDAARAEAGRLCGPLGRLPGVLRRGVRRVVVHRGGADATAFSDEGLIVVYAGNVAKWLATHDLEETVFHESVHATWDAAHASSEGWTRAQLADGAFVTAYAGKHPKREDLAESALFAFTLLRHPGRLDGATRRAVAATIPHRVRYVGELLAAGG